MTYSAIAVANAFLDRAKERKINDISPMKLQKLVFFAHAWSLAVTGKPLIHDDVLAWKYGPVIDSVYREFKRYGSGIVEKKGIEFVRDKNPDAFLKSKFVATNVPKDDISANDIIDAVMDVYGDRAATFLSTLTHKKGSAWEVTRNQHNDGEVRRFVIPNTVIKETTRKELGLDV